MVFDRMSTLFLSFIFFSRSAFMSSSVAAQAVRYRIVVICSDKNSNLLILRFADDIDLLGDNEKELQQLTKSLEKNCCWLRHGNQLLHSNILFNSIKPGCIENLSRTSDSIYFDYGALTNWLHYITKHIFSANLPLAD